MQTEGYQPATWVTEMLNSGSTSFYTVKDGATYYYNILTKLQTKVPGQDSFYILNNIRDNKKV